MISAAIQIAILYLVIYAILHGAKGSRFAQVLTGFGMLAALLVAFSLVLQLEVVSRIIQFLLVYIAVSSVVIFQPEIRRILSTVGAFGYLEKAKHRADGSATPELILECMQKLADRRLGALIAIERGISLRSYEDTGVKIDSLCSAELMTSIFTPPLPLHDGGMVIRNGRLSSAHCIFPVSNNPDLAESGMRHRAAVGLSEETDALVLAVSEERGTISVAHNGKIYRYKSDNAAGILRWIRQAMPEETETSFLKSTLGPLQRLFTTFTKGDAR